MTRTEGTINGQPQGRPVGLPWSTAAVVIFAVMTVGAVVIFGPEDHTAELVALIASTLPSLVAAWKAEKAARSTDALANGFGDRKFQAAVRKVLDERAMSGSADRAQTVTDDNDRRTHRTPNTPEE